VATKLGLYNGALRQIKERALDGVSDDVPPRYSLDGVYDDSLQACLEAGLWNFATRTIEIDASTTIEPPFGFAYAFEQPDDFVRLISISASDTQYPTLDEYSDEAGIWYANANTLYVSYVSNDDEYGLDLSRWPQSFVRAVELDLAVLIAPHITNFSANELIALQKRADRAMANARSKDAANQAVLRPPPGRLVRSRIGVAIDQRRRRTT